MHEDGILTDKDLENPDHLYSKLQVHFKKKKGKIFENFIVDHRATILNLAEDEYKTEHFELSISLYATFIEHTLNWIINMACVKKHIDEKTKAKVLRNVNLNAKCSWLLKILDLPPLKATYVKTILALADERNAYFHYKWKPDPSFHTIPEIEKSKLANTEKYEAIKSVIRYLKIYEAKIEFKGKKVRSLKPADDCSNIGLQYWHDVGT